MGEHQRVSEKNISARASRLLEGAGTAEMRRISRCDLSMSPSDATSRRDLSIGPLGVRCLWISEQNLSMRSLDEPPDATSRRDLSIGPLGVRRLWISEQNLSMRSLDESLDAVSRSGRSGFGVCGSVSGARGGCRIDQASQGALGFARRGGLRKLSHQMTEIIGGAFGLAAQLVDLS